MELGDLFARVAGSTVRIGAYQRDHADGTYGVLHTGTAFAFAEVETKNGRFIALATAGHVLDDHVDRWIVEKYDSQGQLCWQAIHTREPDCAFPNYRRFLDKQTAGRYEHVLSGDFGVYYLSKVMRSGATLPELALLPIIPYERGVTTGSRIAWIGYAEPVESFTGLVTPSYCEGYVSLQVDAVINGVRRWLYLVDGHAMHGMSGAPVWTMLEDGSWFAFGIMRGYRGLPYTSEEDGYAPPLPGFCIVEPINYVLKRVESDHRIIALGKT